jgi:hypothetical protein
MGLCVARCVLRHDLYAGSGASVRGRSRRTHAPARARDDCRDCVAMVAYTVLPRHPRRMVRDAQPSARNPGDTQRRVTHRNGRFTNRNGRFTDAPTGEGDTGAKSIGRLIGAFKTVSTKQINVARRTPGEPVWQRNYWDHIIREGEDIDWIRVYVRDNPLKWSADELNAKM